MSHSARSAVCVAKSKRGDRPLPDAALIEDWLGCSLLGREIHSHSVRAGLGRSFTHLVREASLASNAGGVVIQTIVRRCCDHHSIAVDVDVGRRRSPPLETRCIYSPHLFPLGGELNRSRSRRWSWSWCGAAYSGQDIDSAPSINVV